MRQNCGPRQPRLTKNQSNPANGNLFFGVGLFLLGFEEAADAVEGAGFAEDDHAFEQRWGHGAAGDDGSEEHEVFFDGPGFFFA